MTYNTTGSSNSVTNGSPLQLEIKISPDLPGKHILLMGVFSIDNLDSIADGKELEKLTCFLYGKTDDTGQGKTAPVHICELTFKDISRGKRSYTFNRNFNMAFSYLILKIEAGTCTIQLPVTNLSISFKDKNNKNGEQQSLENTLSFAVQNIKAKPEILSFDADPTVLQGNNKPVHLSWQLKGENYTYTLWDGLNELTNGKGENNQEGSITINSVAIGDHSYTLEVKQGGATVTRGKVVRALDGSQLSRKGNPALPNKIGNFCVSNNSDYLFSLVLNQTSDKTLGSLNYIGFTNEGFSGSWTPFRLTAGDKEKLKPFVTSPMVHLRNAGELYGRLLFIGGSYVKPLECSNVVAIVNLDEDLGLDENADLDMVSRSRVTIVSDLPWSSRMGHNCVAFPHGSEEKIWLLGGVDEWGAALNDIWVSGDGKTWININADGSVNNSGNAAQMPWSPRCLAGASVQLNDDGSKKALWIAGGFSETGGTETADIYRWENGWRQIPLKINNGSYLSSGLAFVGKDTIQSTGMYVLGGYERYVGDSLIKERYFNEIEDLGRNHFNYSKLDTSVAAGTFGTTKNSYIVTGYFKGCLWFMVFTNEGIAGITYSDLFYWVPEVTGQTLILS